MGIRIAWLTALVAALAVSAVAQVPPAPPQRTLQVAGTAERMVPPDTGIVVLAVETQADTVRRAVEQNNTTTNNVMDAVRRLNIANLTLRTLGFDVQPIYEQIPPNRTPPPTPRIVAYRVINRVQARIPDADVNRLSATVGRVLDAALGAGANRVDEVRFELTNRDPIVRELLAEATRNAADTARVLATAAGVTLGPVLSISASPYISPPPQPLLAREAVTAASVPIVAGELTVRAMVNLVYEIR